MSNPAEIDKIFREPNPVVSAGGSRLAQLLFGTVPWTGGVGALVATELQQRQQARLRDFLEKLSHDLARLQQEGHDFVSEDLLDSDEFVALMSGVLGQVSQTADTTQLEYLRRFLSSACRSIRPDATWMQLFYLYVSRLSGVHIVMLRKIYDLQHEIPASDRLGSVSIRNVPLRLRDLASPHYSLELRRISLADLANLGLLVDWQSLSGSGEVQEAYCLSRNGLMFVTFLLGGWTPQDGLPNSTTLSPQS